MKYYLESGKSVEVEILDADIGKVRFIWRGCNAFDDKVRILDIYELAYPKGVQAAIRLFALNWGWHHFSYGDVALDRIVLGLQ